MNKTAAATLQHTVQLGTSTLPYLEDHRIGEVAVLPAAAYLELALAVGASVTRGQPCVLEDVEFHELLLLGSKLVTVNISLRALSPARWRFRIESAPNGDGRRIIHATGRMHSGELPPRPQAVARSELLNRCDERYGAVEHLAAMEARRLHYGPSFQVVRAVARRDGEALAQLQLPRALRDEAQFYRIHPVLLDGAIQSIASAQPEDARPALPVAVGGLAVYEQPGSSLWCHAVVNESETDGTASNNLTLVDQRGVVVAVLRGVRIQPTGSPRSRPDNAAKPVIAVGADKGSDRAPALGSRLSAIWKDVLGLRRLDDNDRFSDLGGDSITAIQIADKAKRAGIDVAPQEILEAQTISNLLGAITAREKEVTS